jgi:large subunit ribosomal protein L5
MMGFDVCVTLARPGRRVSTRRVKAARLPRKQRVSAPEAVSFMASAFGAKVGEAEEAVG